ncbi:MFS_1_like domain-containing protein [Caerostris extrusa]|uniref:MFS_1_like domain-containing protein n=1 Tax=Caerostris extrusa TaxID=172846 RepID=A0AAV4XRF1_CAEEX|nr:MFS_1_like domain-containing protein [Caerostris extrusa]
MWKKTMFLMKNPDVLSFVLVIFILGTAFCFTKNFMFWYLEGMNSPSFLIGLIPAVRYSFLQDPWYSLVLEGTNIFTYHLLWVAVVLYSHEIAPEGLTSTVIATAGSIHYHIGKSSGSLVGGFIMDAFNGRVAFRVVGIICLVSAVLYALYLYIRRTCFTLVREHPAGIEDQDRPNVVTMKVT